MSGIGSLDKPIKESYLALTKYPKFSTVEKMDARFYEVSVEACRDIAREIRELVKTRNV